MKIRLILAASLLLLSVQVNAAMIVSSGSGTAVSQVDLLATFDGMTEMILSEDCRGLTW